MIDAAYRVLRSGDGSAPLSRILREAGLSTRAFYRHFQSKDDLLIAMFDAEGERTADVLAARLTGVDDPQLALATWIDQNLAVFLEPRRARRTRVMLSAEMRRVAGYDAALDRNHERLRVSLLRILREGRARGVFAHTDPDRDAGTILDIVQRSGLDRGARSVPGDRDAEAVTRHVVDFVGRALGTTIPAAPAAVDG